MSVDTRVTIKLQNDTGEKWSARFYRPLLDEGKSMHQLDKLNIKGPIGQSLEFELKRWSDEYDNAGTIFKVL